MIDDSKLSLGSRHQDDQDVVLLRARLEMAQTWIQNADGWLRNSVEIAREAQVRADDALTWAHRSALRLHQEKVASEEFRRKQLEAEQRCAELGAYVHALTHSFSWRVSLPVRVISRAVRRTRRLLIRVFSSLRTTTNIRKTHIHEEVAPACTKAGNPAPVNDSLMAPVPIAHHVSMYAQQLRGVPKSSEAS